jgi:hypothetical protein
MASWRIGSRSSGGREERDIGYALNGRSLWEIRGEGCRTMESCYLYEAGDAWGGWVSVEREGWGDDEFFEGDVRWLLTFS